MCALHKENECSFNIQHSFFRSIFVFACIQYEHFVFIYLKYNYYYLVTYTFIGGTFLTPFSDVEDRSLKMLFITFKTENYS